VDVADREAATMFHRMAIALVEMVDRYNWPERRRAQCLRDGSAAMVSASDASFDTSASLELRQICADLPKAKPR
jgi:hypothetical protein